MNMTETVRSSGFAVLQCMQPYRENTMKIAMQRFTGTLVGAAYGLLILLFDLNIMLPMGLDGIWWFGILTLSVAAALNDVLVGRMDSFSDFSKVELNRMLDAGIQFTIMTMRTPASYLEVAKDIRIKLPVILMNGAVLYDVKNNSYIKKLEIPHEEACEIKKLINNFGENCFTNIIEENSVIILYDELVNEGEKAVYNQLRKSPYRNYSCRPLGDREAVVYFMVVDRRERIENLYAVMERAGYAEKYRICHYESDEYPGFAYLKLYHKDASKQHMLKELQRILEVTKVCTIGSVPGEYDLVVDENNPGDEVVRQLYRLCMPVKWPWKKSGVKDRGMLV